jgi:hypothetical protein
MTASESGCRVDAVAAWLTGTGQDRDLAAHLHDRVGQTTRQAHSRGRAAQLTTRTTVRKPRGHGPRAVPLAPTFSTRRLLGAPFA